MGAGSSTSGSAMFAGEGGCFSVKIRGGPLQVHDRAVLRVTESYVRLLRILGSHEAIYSKEDEANPRNVLLHLEMGDMKSFALAGRFFSITAPYEGSDAVRSRREAGAGKAENTFFSALLLRRRSVILATKDHLQAAGASLLPASPARLGARSHAPRLLRPLSRGRLPPLTPRADARLQARSL
jgi:hypothetical protein